jgi:hypothetical protein
MGQVRVDTMVVLKAVSLDEIQARGEISTADVLKLRRAFYADVQISTAEAEQLIALNRDCAKADPAWFECFVEMLTDHVVNQAAPEGYVTVENANWLTAQIAPTGHIASRAEFELLVNILDKSRWSPLSLETLALAQVRDGILLGQGPLASAERPPAPVVTEADVEALRRIIYAFGGDSNITITQAEAEILFAINDGTVGQANAESWGDLFVKAIANCVLSASGYTVPSREQALAREAWLDRRGDLSLGRMLSGMFAGYRELGPEEQAISRLERQKIEIVTGEQVTVAEASWLAGRIGRDGQVSGHEAALLAFLNAENPTLHPDLQGLLERARKAA